MKTPEQKAKHAAYMREWMRKNPEKAKANSQKTYLRNRAKILKAVAEYKKAHRVRYNELNRQYKQRNAEKIKAYAVATVERTKELNKIRYQLKKEEISKQQRAYYQENREQILAKNAKYMHEKRDAVREQQSKYRKHRRERDTTFRLLNNCRKRMWNALHGVGAKSARTMELLGCNGEQLRQWLESKFIEGMNWDNYGQGGWHVDHIKPIALFDLTDSTQQRMAFHFTNVQPLWDKENRRKWMHY